MTPADDEPPLFKDEPIDLSDLRWDDAIVFVAFWALAVVVFLQFFTRYVLNDSFGWTEEIARYLLIAVTFTGAVMAVRKESHIAVEFLYRWMPRPLRRVMQIVVDLVCLAFYGALTWFSIALARSTRQKMASIKVPKSVIYWGVAACFAAMTLYALIVLVRHLRSGSGRLVDPESYAETLNVE
jgi:TRAP-type C4-dicarboxylate transport system permease small subunit